MSNLHLIEAAIKAGDNEQAAEHLLALAYKLNKIQRMLHKLELQKVKDELNSVLKAGE
jgi:hypothetical protein